jgi:glycosyltransferase 2 family protein
VRLSGWQNRRTSTAPVLATTLSGPQGSCFHSDRALTLREPCCYGAAPMRRSLRKVFFVALAVILVGVVLYRFRGAITLQGFRWQRLAESVREAQLRLLLLSILVIYACYGIRALRWVRFSRALGPASFPNVYSATLMGFTAVFLLGRAGEPVRPLLIARKDNLPISGSFGIYVLERIMDASATAALAGLALLVLPIRVLPNEKAGPLLAAARTTGTTLLAGLVALVVFLMYFRWSGAEALAPRLEHWRARGGWRLRLAKVLEGFGEGLRAIHTWADLFAAIGYTTLHWLLVALVYLWVPHSFGGDFLAIDFGGAMLLLAFSVVGSTLQLPGVGGGTQVAAFLVFTVIFGVEKEPAAAAAITLWLVSFAAPCLAGLPLLIREGWSMGELRQLARVDAADESAGRHSSIQDQSRQEGESH